jgi:hypothetical protein
MNSFRGDASQLMTQYEDKARAAGPATGLPSNDGRVPLGAQSIVAAGVDPSRVAYAPFPPGVSPPVNPPPVPPTHLPEPPPANAYANAFAPPPPPGYTTAPQPAVVPIVTNPAYAQGAAVEQPASPPPGAVATVNYPLPPVQPIQYNPAPPPPPQPVSNPAMDRRQPPAPTLGTPVADPAASAELTQLLQVLRESPYPAQREWAANSLATYDWRGHPELVQSLLIAAKQDPAATVRAASVYSLGRLNAASEPVVSTLRSLRNDSDARVRQEVEQTLVRLGVNMQ